MQQQANKEHAPPGEVGSRIHALISNLGYNSVTLVTGALMGRAGRREKRVSAAVYPAQLTPELGSRNSAACAAGSGPGSRP